MNRPSAVIFDLDGTLLDSDKALRAPFAALGVDPTTVPWGLPLPEACTQVEIEVDDYLARYDPNASAPFPGVEELLEGLERWGICSNKHPVSGRPELQRLGWHPHAAWFNAGSEPKRLDDVLDAMGHSPDEVVFVGDTDHDRVCAEAVGCRFALAAWNPRARVGGDAPRLRRPQDVLALLT